MLKQIQFYENVNISLMFICNKYCTYQPTYHYPTFTLFLVRKNSKLKKGIHLVALLWSQMTMDNKSTLHFKGPVTAMNGLSLCPQDRVNTGLQKHIVQD